MLAENFGLCQKENHEAHAQTECQRIASTVTEVNLKEQT